MSGSIDAGAGFTEDDGAGDYLYTVNGYAPVAITWNACRAARC
jgi:hypothetical protein